MRKLISRHFLLCCKTAVTILFPVYGSGHPDTELLSHLSAVAQIGYMVPQGNLAQKLTGQPAYGIKLASPYYRKLQSHITAGYVMLDGDDSPRKLHFFKMGAGLAYELPSGYLPLAGMDFNNYTVKSVGKTDGPKLLLDEFESEFGVCPFLLWEVLRFRKAILQLGIQWDIVFSQPRYSRFLSFSLGTGWRLW
ncbi:hypothetical protein ACFL5V_07065 [Fibrobacterota bacterium]